MLGGGFRERHAVELSPWLSTGELICSWRPVPPAVDSEQLSSGRGCLPEPQNSNAWVLKPGGSLRICCNPQERHNSCLLREIFLIRCKHDISPKPFGDPL